MDETTDLTRSQENMLVFAAIVGAFLSVLNSTNINIALPSLMEYYQTDMASAQWIVVGYMMATGLILPTVGYFMDRFSGRNLMVLGLALLAAASILCAMAPTVELMVAARILQGMAGGIIMPVPSAMVYQFIPRERQLMTISIVSMVVSVGVAMGPSVSGVLIHYWNWKAIFLINIPAALLDILLVLKFVPCHKMATGSKLDLTGLFCASAGTVGLLLGFHQGDALGWTSPVTVLLLLGSIAMLSFFIWHALHISVPLLNFRVFQYAGFTYGFLLNSVATIATCLAPLYMSLFLQDVLGLDAMRAGLSMFVPSMLMAAMAPVAAKWAERWSRRLVIFAGMVVLILATWRISNFALSTTILAFTIWLSLRYIGLGLINPLVNNFAMSAVPVKLVSHASAMIAWTRQMISTISVSLFSLLYSNHMLRYTAQNMGAQLGQTDQLRLIECTAINDVNFYSLLILLICVPMIYFMKDQLLESQQ
ncbi:MAG: DHA2 family efflux MFS transporter permease subunit [Peptococcaceae bacterium]